MHAGLSCWPWRGGLRFPEGMGGQGLTCGIRGALVTEALNVVERGT